MNIVLVFSVSERIGDPVSLSHYSTSLEGLGGSLNALIDILKAP